MDENFNINPSIADREEPVGARDPFADDWAGAAFVDDEFNLNLNKLLHLVPYSEFLLVSGPEGGGKSTLLHQFVIAAKKSWKVVHVRSSSLMTAEELLRQVVHGFGLPAAGVDKIEEMLAEIGRYFQALGRSGRRAIVVIDDAHLLDDDVLESVEHILSDEGSTNAISLVLAVDERVAGSRFNNFPVLLHKLAYTLHLAPLTEAGVADYIRHRLIQSDDLSAESFFNEEVVKQIQAKSGGLPGKLNELARHHLSRSEGEAPVGVGGRSLVRWGVVIAGVVLVGVVLLFQEQINQLVMSPQPPSEVAEVVAPPADEAAVDETKGPSASEGEEIATTEPLLTMGDLEKALENQATPEVVAPMIADVSPPSTQAPTPESTKPVADGVAKTEEAGKRGEQKGWLQSQNPKHFTLQLMALQDEAEVRQFVKRHRLQGQSEIFHIIRKNDRLTALAYGSFPDRAAVDAAVKKLPKEWGVKEPWVRTFASVVKDAEKAN